jgi:hypothetical protein
MRTGLLMQGVNLHGGGDFPRRCCIAEPIARGSRSHLPSHISPKASLHPILSVFRQGCLILQWHCGALNARFIHGIEPSEAGIVEFVFVCTQG